MYLHLGQEEVVRGDEIVGIFDIDNTTVSRGTRVFLKKAEEAGAVTYVTLELPKSFAVCSPPAKKHRARPVLTGNKKKAPPPEQQVYIAQISPATLAKRARREQGER